MATSTTTLFQAVNAVLQDIGERRVTNLTSPPAEKAKRYLIDAVRFIATIHDWEFLHNRIIATNWLGDSFTVPSSQQIRGVSWLSTTGIGYDLKYVDIRQFDMSSPQSFSTLVSSSTRPIMYTLPNYQTVRVNPYPTDVLGQARIVTYVIEDLVPPTTDTGLFPIPEKYMQLIIKKACYYMSMNHLEDPNSAGGFDRDFQEMIGRYRVNEQKTPTGGFNMYRSRTRKYWSGGY